MLDAASENRAPEDDAAVLEKRFQICEDGCLRLRRGGEAVEDPVQRDRGKPGGPEVERLECARLDDSRRVTLQAARRLGQACVARVEKRDLRAFDRKAAPVEEIAGADADIEMRAADVLVVQVEEVSPRAPPDQAAREAEDEQVVEGEPCRGVDGDAGMGLERLHHAAGGSLPACAAMSSKLKLMGLECCSRTGVFAGRRSAIATAIGNARIPTTARAICADLTAEAEWLVGHEEHREDEGDADEEDLQLPALLAVRAAGADGNGGERSDGCEQEQEERGELERVRDAAGAGDAERVRLPLTERPRRPGRGGSPSRSSRARSTQRRRRRRSTSASSAGARWGRAAART